MSLALLLTIALGTGSNVSVNGFVRGLTRAGLPTSAGTLVSIFDQNAQAGAGPLSYQQYRLLKSRLETFAWIGGARVSSFSIAIGGQSSIASVAALTSNLANSLHLPLEKGVVISHRLWQNEFGSQANVRGEQIRVNGVNLRVTGVAPDWLEGLYGDRAIDLWMRWQENTTLTAERSSGRNLWVLAQLHPHVSLRQAQLAISSLSGIPGETSILPYTGMMPEMAASLSRNGTLLHFAANAVFFIACANVISFLLGRAFARSHETSLRVALGASRSQLARELLSDSVVISIAGGALGLLLAAWTARVVPALLFDQDAERLVFAPGLFTIVAASVICAGITIICGLVPVIVTRIDRPGAVLRREGAGPSSAMRRLRMALVVTQMTSCCILVISTAFLLDGLRAALQTNAGHRLGNPILATVQKQPGPDSGIRFFEQVEQAAHAMTGITETAWAGRLPGTQPAWQSFRIEPPSLPLREITLDIVPFTPRSLNLFTFPAKAGRLFGFGDQSCRVAIVNEQAAAELFDKSTVGRTIHDPAGLPVEIIGVLGVKPKPGAPASRPAIYFNDSGQTGPAPSPIASAHFRAPIRSDLATADLDSNVVSPSYFHAMGLSLVTGRPFSDHQVPGGCRVAVLNQEAADLYFGGQPVGAAVIDEQGIRTSILGVVQSRPLGSFQRHAEPAIYFPMSQDCLPRMTLIASVRNTKDSTLDDLRRRIEAVPGRGPAPVIVTTLTAHLAHTALAPLRIATILLGASATTALLLSSLGLFGALSDAARQRRRELAIRIALGAQRWRIIYLVLKEGARLAAAGILLGLLGSLALSRWLARITAGQTSPAWWIWMIAPLVLASAVLLTSVLPARRALLLNPLTIMRDDN